MMAAKNENKPKIEDGLYKFNFDGSLMGYIYAENNELLFEGDSFGIEKGGENSKVDLTYGSFESEDKRGLAGTKNETYLLKLVFHGMGISDFVLYGNFIENEKNLKIQNGEKLLYMDEDAIRIMEDDYEQSDDYTHTYELKPENQGKIIFLTGGMGFGKSTSAEILKKEHGFVLYEGDCYLFGYNPFPGMSPKGPSYFGTKLIKKKSKERMQEFKKFMKSIEDLIKTGEKRSEDMIPMYGLMCDDIIREKAKIGGNWVVPIAVYLRDVRDLVRNKLGPDCVFVILEVEDDVLLRRLAKRNLGTAGGEVTQEAIEEEMKKAEARKEHKNFEGYQEGEENTIVIKVEENMTPQNVVDIIVEKINAF